MNIRQFNAYYGVEEYRYIHDAEPVWLIDHATAKSEGGEFHRLTTSKGDLLFEGYIDSSGSVDPKVYFEGKVLLWTFRKIVDTHPLIINLIKKGCIERIDRAEFLNR